MTVIAIVVIIVNYVYVVMMMKEMTALERSLS